MAKMKWGLLVLGVLACASAQAQLYDTSVRDRIYAAASAGDVAELKRLESLGYSLEMTDASGNTPYCQAVWSQSRTAVAALIAAGVNVKPSCLKRIPYVTETRIYAAAHSEDLDQLVAWKKEGLNVDVVNPKTGNSALCEAVYNYDCPAIQTLLRAGSQQAQPCMRRVPVEVREKLQCRPLKIDWSTIGYTVLGVGMAGALVAILGSGGGNGTPTCPVTQRWNGDKCMSCSTCWIGNRCISSDEMKKKPYYRDETTADCWTVAPPPVRMSESELESQAARISSESDYTTGGYLPMINAAEAYARGYSGYMVERTSPYGRLVNGDVPVGGKPKLSDKKVTVAVYSSGMTIPTVGTASETVVNSSTGKSTTSKKTVWDFEGVHKGFYDAEAVRSDIEYTTGTGSNTQTVNDHNYVGYAGSVTNNFAMTTDNKPIGYNFDYGACGTGDNARTTNCYGSVTFETVKDKDGKDVTLDPAQNLAVFYDGNGNKTFLLVDSKTGVIRSKDTTADPTKETISSYATWEAVNNAFFKDLKYDNGYEYDEDEVAPHYTNSSSGSDVLVGSKGTLLAGVVAAMKLPANLPAETYGVAYNAAILPVNRDVVFGLTDEAMSKMVGSAQVVLLDETTYATTPGVNDALGAFTSSSGTYTSRKVVDVLGVAAYNAYNMLNRDKTGTVAVVPNGNYQTQDLSLKQPSLQSVVPLLSEFNGSTVWTSTSKVLPTVGSNNPLYHLYITVGSLESISTENDVTTGELASYSQPCGIAGSYCVVAPGGQSATTNGIYSTTDPGLTGSSSGYSYNYTYGTSIAAASVAGAVALLMGAYPHLTSQQVVEILFKTATYIEPTSAQQTSYGNTYAVGSDYLGMYNSIFGRGLINLAAATEPICGKDGLWVYKATYGNAIGQGTVVKASATHLLSPAGIASANAISSALPSSFVAFDAYDRPFKLPTAGLFQLKNRRKTKSWDDFKMFMRGRDPVLVEATENFSMMYRDQTSRVSSSSQIPMGLMQVNLKKDKMRYSLFYSQDTTMGKEAYWKRRMTNPFIQMKDAYGVETGYDFNSKWSVEVGWTMGKNGFFDDDDRHFDAPDNKMQAFTSAVVFKPIDKVAFKVATGVMKETGSSLGMVSEGAFNIKGADTHFVGAGVTFTPMDKIRLEAMYYYGQTKTNSDKGLMNLSRLTSDSFAVTASYQPTEDHLLGLQVSSPLRVRKGTLNITLPTGRHPTEDIYYYDTYKANMKPKARELDLSMYYQGNVTDELSLQSEMGVRLNPDHQADATPDYRGMVGIKWAY